MIKSIKNFIINMMLEDKIDATYDMIFFIDREILSIKKIADIPTELKAELNAYQNMQRRLIKLKEKYK